MNLDYEAYGVPAHTAGAIDRYLNHGFEPGSFVMAVMHNDLNRAVASADSVNQAALVDIVKFFYNEVPARAWGNADRVQNYIESVRAAKQQA